MASSLEAGGHAMWKRSEGLAGDSVSFLREALAQLRDIWEEMGIPKDQRLQRTQVVQSQVQNLLDRIITEEQNLKELLLRSIQDWRTQLTTLCQELQLAPFQEDGEATLLEQEKVLRCQVEVLQKQKQEREQAVQALQALQEQERELCRVLSVAPTAICASTLPTLVDLDFIRLHLAGLQAEKERRQAEFADTRQKIIVCMEDLEHVPDTSFEREVVGGEEDAFCLSEENMAALRHLLQQLESRKAQKEALCNELQSKIQVLWERLHIPADQRVPCMAGSRSETLNALQTELERLETLKPQHLRIMVEAIRVELADYWEKCFYGKEQRESFSVYYQDDFSEELLQQHEEEIERIKAYYETHRELLEAVHKWEENWHLFRELERKATDPSRFTNRGGILLKEGNLRAKLQKMLPKLEEELRDRLTLWEQAEGQAFLVNGQRFMERVAEQRQLHHLEKAREKQERLEHKKSGQSEEETIYGSTPRMPSNHRTLGTHVTSGKVQKLNTTQPPTKALSAQR